MTREQEPILSSQVLALFLHETLRSDPRDHSHEPSLFIPNLNPLATPIPPSHNVVHEHKHKHQSPPENVTMDPACTEPHDLTHPTSRL